MITTNKKINLAQLHAELKSTGLNMESIDDTNTITALDESITDAQLKAAIDNHVASVSAGLTIAEKLASVGLSIEDLKAALA